MMKKKLKHNILTLALMSLCLTNLYSDNLIFNSSFELGGNGYVCEKYLRPETNPKLIYTPPQVDVKSFTSGRQSLMVPNHFAEAFDLQSREFKIVPGKWYTFSIDMKSSVSNYPVTVSFVTVKKYRRRTAKQQKTFTVGKTWKRYVFRFKAYSKDELKYYYLRIDNGKKLTSQKRQSAEPPAATLWLDSLRLTSGKSGKYASSGKIEIAVVPENKLIEKSGSVNHAKVSVLMHNATAKETEALLTLSAVDVYSGKLVAKKIQPLTIGAGKSTQTVIPVKLNKYGSYKLMAGLDGSFPVKALPDNIAVIGKVGQMADNYKYDFSVGLDGSLGWRGFPMKSGNVDSFKPGYRAVGYSPLEGMELVAKMGCRLVRPRKVFNWSVIEPDEGKFDFRNADYVVNATQRNGIKLAPCLGAMEFMTRRWGGGKVAALPAWLQKKSKKSAYAPMLKKYRQKFIYLPPMKLWKRYIRKVAERYKGKITHWEIMNEPNLFIIPEDYVIYLKAAYSVLKEVDENNLVVGFCATGDLGGSVNSFLGKAFRLGGLEYADIVAFHPYHARTMASPKPADKMIHEVNSLFRRFSKKEILLWNTELYFLKDNDDSGYYDSEFLAHRFLTDLGEGVKQSICVQKTTLLHPVKRYYQSLASDKVQFPDSNFVIYNTLARIFMGAKPVNKIKWPSNSICYIYEKNGRYIAAFWHYGNINGLTLSADIKSSEAGIYDLFGNQICFDRAILPLTAKPYYIFWKGKDLNNFINKLKNIKISSDIPVQLGGFRMLMSPEGWQGVLGITNVSTEPVSGEMTVKGRGIEVKRPVNFNVPGGLAEAITFPVEVTGNFPDEVSAELLVNGKKFKLTTNKCFAQPTIYYASKGQGKSVRITSEHFSGSAQHKAGFAVRYDKKDLYIDVKVTDSTPSGKANNRAPWSQDCVELMIDTRPADHMVKNSTAHHPFLTRLFILPYADHKVSIWRRGLKKLQVVSKVNVNAKGYSVSLKIPFEKLGMAVPVTGKSVGFEVLVDNVKGASSDAVQLRWNSKGSAHKDRSEFGLIYFK